MGTTHGNRHHVRNMRRWRAFVELLDVRWCSESYRRPIHVLLIQIRMWAARLGLARVNIGATIWVWVRCGSGHWVISTYHVLWWIWTGSRIVVVVCWGLSTSVDGGWVAAVRAHHVHRVSAPCCGILLRRRWRIVHLTRTGGIGVIGWRRAKLRIKVVWMARRSIKMCCVFLRTLVGCITVDFRGHLIPVAAVANRSRPLILCHTSIVLSRLCCFLPWRFSLVSVCFLQCLRLILFERCGGI